MNVAIYARVSTTQQAEKGYSLETQIEACKKKAMEMGATSIKEYIDDGYSGAYLERPAVAFINYPYRIMVGNQRFRIFDSFIKIKESFTKL